MADRALQNLSFLRSPSAALDPKQSLGVGRPQRERNASHLPFRKPGGIRRVGERPFAIARANDEVTPEV
jgi:hypothetical protein